MNRPPDIRQYVNIKPSDRITPSIHIGNSKRLIFINRSKDEVFIRIAESIGRVEFNIKRSVDQKTERRSKRR